MNNHQDWRRAAKELYNEHAKEYNDRRNKDSENELVENEQPTKVKKTKKSYKEKKLKIHTVESIKFAVDDGELINLTKEHGDIPDNAVLVRRSNKNGEVEYILQC